MNTVPPEIPDLFDHAVSLHEAGHLAAAIEAYRRILASDGEDAVLLELLGSALAQSGAFAEGIAFLDRSIEIDASSATAWLQRSMAKSSTGELHDALCDSRAAFDLDRSSAVAGERLATLLLESGDLEEAWQVLTRSIEANPSALELARTRAIVAVRQGRVEDAARDLDRLLAAIPEDPTGLSLLAQVRASQGLPREALEAARRAFSLDRDRDDSRLNLLTALVATGEVSDAREAKQLLDEAASKLLPLRDRARIEAVAETVLGQVDSAIDSLRRWAEAHPEDREASVALASALRGAGRVPESVAIARRAAAIAPDDSRLAIELGRGLLELGDPGSAIAVLERARAIGGAPRDVTLELVRALRTHGMLGEAILVAEEAIRDAPADPELGITLTTLLHDVGRHPEAVALGERVVAGDAVPAALRSDHLLGLHYSDERDEATVKEAHVRLAGRDPIVTRPPDSTDRDETRLLRVGLVSGDLQAHAVAWFLLPLLRRLARDRVAVFAYSNGRTNDLVTAAMRREVHAWREIVGRGDEQVVEIVRGDRIDVLVDLSGHTRGNRLGVFRHAPAPVAMTWLGYPNTTGIREIGWRIVDGVTDPIGAEDHATEALLRIDAPFLCFDCDSIAVESPRRSSRPMTFGSFNNPAKLSERCLTLWSRVLAAVPESRMLLKYRGFADEGFRRSTLDRFARFGLAEARIDLRGFSRNVADHHRAYADLDIALDTFPYHGTTTTCEALWNGVPVVSRIGEVHRARVGKTILHAVGLPELACEDDDSFVAAAVDLAADVDRRQALHLGLRAQMSRSPLCDATSFARRFEAAIRHAWRGWCRGEEPRGVFLSDP